MSLKQSKSEDHAAKSLDTGIIRYSRVWEDHKVLSEALNIQPTDVVLSITSSGDNILNLLLEEPRAIIAIDVNNVQNAVLELKISGIKSLEYLQFLKLLGETPAQSDERVLLYERVKGLLPEYAKSYWDTHLDTIAEGVCQSGRLGRGFRMYSHLLGEQIDSSLLDKFFTVNTIEEQQVLFDSFPEEPFQDCLRNTVSKDHQAKGLRSAAQLKHVHLSSEEIFASFWERFVRVCRTVPAKYNFYLSWYLRDYQGYDPMKRKTFCPLYLREESFGKLKGLLDRINVVNATLEEFLLAPDITFHKANLSDVFEYLGEPEADALFKLLVSKCAAGGRLAYWNLFCPRKCPPLENVRSLKELSASLHQKDRVYFYGDFFVDEIL